MRNLNIHDMMFCIMMLRLAPTIHYILTSITYFACYSLDNKKYVPCTAKHLRGKLLQFEYKMTVHWKTFAVAASFNSECLWLVNYSL